MVVEAIATAGGTFPLIPAALIFRLDGIVATLHVGEREVLQLEEGDRIDLRLDLGPILLGNGTYLLSVGLYQELDIGNTHSSIAVRLLRPELRVRGHRKPTAPHGGIPSSRAAGRPVCSDRRARSGVN